MDSAICLQEVTRARCLPMLAPSPLSMSRLSLIVDLASLLAREVDFDTLLGTACERLARALRADRATIWIVDAEHGDLVTRVAVLPGDTPDTLAARILIAEHQLYPRELAALVAAAASPDRLVAEVRARAMALPAADEIVSHGMACFGITKGKKFAYVSIDHHGDGKTALLVKISGLEEQESLIERDPERHYRPAYFGDGWIGIRLDHGDTDWDNIAEWLARSWRAVAPKRLAMLLI